MWGDGGGGQGRRVGPGLGPGLLPRVGHGRGMRRCERLGKTLGGWGPRRERASAAPCSRRAPPPRRASAARPRRERTSPATAPQLRPPVTFPSRPRPRTVAARRRGGAAARRRRGRRRVGPRRCWTGSWQGCSGAWPPRGRWRLRGPPGSGRRRRCGCWTRPRAYSDPTRPDPARTRTRPGPGLGPDRRTGLRGVALSLHRAGRAVGPLRQFCIDRHDGGVMPLFRCRREACPAALAVWTHAGVLGAPAAGLSGPARRTARTRCKLQLEITHRCAGRNRQRRIIAMSRPPRSGRAEGARHNTAAGQEGARSGAVPAVPGAGQRNAGRRRRREPAVKQSSRPLHPIPPPPPLPALQEQAHSTGKPTPSGRTIRAVHLFCARKARARPGCLIPRQEITGDAGSA